MKQIRTMCLLNECPCLTCTMVIYPWLCLQVSVTVRLPSGSDYSLELDLAHPITPQQSRAKVMASKVHTQSDNLTGQFWCQFIFSNKL